MTGPGGSRRLNIVQPPLPLPRSDFSTHALPVPAAASFSLCCCSFPTLTPFVLGSPFSLLWPPLPAGSSHCCSHQTLLLCLLALSISLDIPIARMNLHTPPHPPCMGPPRAWPGPDNVTAPFPTPSQQCMESWERLSAGAMPYRCLFRRAGALGAPLLAAGCGGCAAFLLPAAAAPAALPVPRCGAAAMLLLLPAPPGCCCCCCCS